MAINKAVEVFLFFVCTNWRCSEYCFLCGICSNYRDDVYGESTTTFVSNVISTANQSTRFESKYLLKQIKSEKSTLKARYYIYY